MRRQAVAVGVGVVAQHAGRAHIPSSVFVGAVAVIVGYRSLVARRKDKGIQAHVAVDTRIANVGDPCRDGVRTV